MECRHTKNGLEVDFVLNRGEVAVGAKAAVRSWVSRPIHAVAEEYSPHRAIAVTAEHQPRRVGEVDIIIPYAAFPAMLHDGELL